MNFKKDLLLVDLEMTGLDVARHEIIQLAAVLLDKKTLKEKAFFNTYIRPARWAARDAESMRVNGIKKEWLDAAPAAKMVFRNFSKKFAADKVLLSYYGGPADMDFLRAAYGRHNIPWRFDYHYFNLWGVFYALLARRNELKNPKKFSGFCLEDLMKKYRLHSKSRHDALTDCRLEAEVLRKILKQTK